jgi:hypothetical protein
VCAYVCIYLHTHTHTHTHLLAVTGQASRLAQNVFDRVGVFSPLRIGFLVEGRGLVLVHFNIDLRSIFHRSAQSLRPIPPNPPRPHPPLGIGSVQLCS